MLQCRIIMSPRAAASFRSLVLLIRRCDLANLHNNNNKYLYIPIYTYIYIQHAHVCTGRVHMHMDIARFGMGILPRFCRSPSCRERRLLLYRNWGRSPELEGPTLPITHPISCLQQMKSKEKYQSPTANFYSRGLDKQHGSRLSLRVLLLTARKTVQSLHNYNFFFFLSLTPFP